MEPDGTPGGGASGGTPGGFSAAALLEKGKAKEQELLDRLREFFEEKAVPFDDAWRVEVKIRATGTSLGTTDAYYFSPAGKRYRSRMEIARDFGLADDKPARLSGGGGGGSGRSRKSDSGVPAAAAAAAAAPLSREAAVAAAQKRLAAFKLPHMLACGVTVTNLGSLRPADPAFTGAERLWPAGYTAEWEDEKGVRFINSITETPSGPVFRVKAQRLPHDGKPATEVVELGGGPNPDAAYQDAEERQAEALEIALLNRSMRHRAGRESEAEGQPGSPVPPAGRALDAAEHLLVKCRPLSQQWGTERFGLADIAVLQAIEGLPSANYCAAYTFVDSRSGGWLAETRRLNADLAAHGKQQLPVDTRRVSGEGSAPRKRPPRPSRKEAEENAIKRVIDSMVRHVELEEVKNCSAEQKARMQMEKQLEREKKKADKDKMSTAMHKLREHQRLQQKAAFIEAQRRQAELNATVEDSELPNPEEPPPEPSAIGAGRLPLQQQAVLLEAWQFVSRFGEPLLGLQCSQQLPTLQQLEAALLGELPPPPPPPPSPETAADEAEAAAGGGDVVEVPPPPGAAVELQMALVDFLVGGLFQDTAQAIIGANSDITLSDLRGAGRHTHPLAIKQETWQEAARRYLTVLATTAMTQAKDGGNAGLAAPLAVMDPWVILQYLTAGPPATLTQGAAALPRGASKTSGHSVIARADAAALAAAEQAFAAAAGASSGRGVEAVREEQQLLRCLLKDVIQASKVKKGDGRVLCYGGQAAAAAAKFGRPLDLKCIASRIDAGLYSALPRPLDAFAADVKYACSLYQAGCNKHNSLFAQEYVDKAAPELAARAVSRLESLLREVELTGPADYLAQHAQQPGQRRQQRLTPEPGGAAAAAGDAAAAGREESVEPLSQAAGGDGQAGAGDQQQQQQQQRQATDAVRDLDRPFAPFKETGSWRGCVVCWSDEDAPRLLLCDTCDCQQHSYCMEPPLEELPLPTEPFLCPRCLKQQGSGGGGGGKPLSVEFARSSGGRQVWRLAQLLATADYSDWSVEDRCALLRLLCSLCAESARLHDTLHGEEDEVKEKKKEIASLKLEAKRVQAEIAEQQQQQQQPPAAAGAAAADAGAGGASPAVAGQQQVQQQQQRRSRGRDPAAELESMVERISRLEHEICSVGPVRLEPVGLDRHYNRYWLLPAAAAASDPANVASEAPPLLIIERHSLDSILPAGAAAAAAAMGGGGGAAGSTASWQVGLYNSILQLQQLAQWLNPKGTREKPLATEVTRLLDQHQQFAMQHVQPPRQPQAEAAEPADPAALKAAALQRLQQAMLLFEEGNQAATYDELCGSEQRRQQWRQMVAAASTPQVLMQALLVLQGMVRPEFLKQQWRPFAIPAPHPADTSTLPAVWLRLEALKACVKLKVTLNVRLAKEALGGALVQGTRYSLREVKPSAKRNYYEGPGSSRPASRADSGAESEGDDDEDEEGKETRAERVAKRAAKQRVPDDEAMARELDSELNAGTRRTRMRHADGSDRRQRQQQQQQHALEDEEEWDDGDDQGGDSPDEDMEYAESE